MTGCGIKSCSALSQSSLVCRFNESGANLSAFFKRSSSVLSGRAMKNAQMSGDCTTLNCR
jgi:hypothetical protein